MSKVDLTKLDREELAEKLRELPVADWNAAVIEARMKASRWRADLCGAGLWGANLRGSDLRDANLVGANLRRADLRRADLVGANLVGANLSDADLRGSDLRGADLVGANLRDANLWGADLRGADLWGEEEQLELNGKHIAVGSIGGYTALVFGANNSEGHVIRAGCWTGTVDGLLDRARGEFGDDSTMELVRALESFIRAVLAQWEAGE